MNRIDGKVAVVTGGTQGLGAAIARPFAQAGAAGIAIVGRDAEKGSALADAIFGETGVPVLMIAADLGDMAQVLGVVGKAEARFPALSAFTAPHPDLPAETHPPSSAGHRAR